MRKIFVLSLLLPHGFVLMAQIKIARIQEDHSIQVETIPAENNALMLRTVTFEQLAGFPVRAEANKSFKNLRNVTLADINKDGLDDILWGADRLFFVHTYEGLLWEKPLSSTIIYPPSIANLDGSGSEEIVQSTGGSSTNSSIYLFNIKGQDREGWPLSFDGNWIITAPALADLDNDGNLEIIFNERDNPINRLHAVRVNGKSFSEDWPVAVLGKLAVTPSIGDIDADGEIEIYTSTTTTRYVFDLRGEWEVGWPQETGPEQRYSFQSPLLYDFNQDSKLEIIGASHGDSPQYFALQSDGSFLPGWPQLVPESSWTFSPPTIIKLNNEPQILMSRPIGESEDDMLYTWNKDGTLNPSFPLVKSGGLEGIISVADIDGDDEFEIIFGSNQVFPDGNGFIHAYELDGTTEVPGFPIRPRGWTYMNGANLGDINGDGLMDLVALSYTQNENPALMDSIYLNVYNLEAPYSPEKVLWSTYKGDNTRDGLLFKSSTITSTAKEIAPEYQFELYPNPTNGVLFLTGNIQKPTSFTIELLNPLGGTILTDFTQQINPGNHHWQFDIQDAPAGLLELRIWSNDQPIQTITFIKQ